jgi:hypothetical protein
MQYNACVFSGGAKDDMPFAFLMTDYIKRLEAGDPHDVAFRDNIVKLWRTMLPYLITHRTKEWWEVGCH